MDTPAGAEAGSATRPIVEVVADDHVILDIENMEPGRSYTYRLGGEWLAAVKKPSGQIDFYAVPKDQPPSAEPTPAQPPADEAEDLYERLAILAELGFDPATFRAYRRTKLKAGSADGHDPSVSAGEEETERSGPPASDPLPPAKRG